MVAPSDLDRCYEKFEIDPVHTVYAEPSDYNDENKNKRPQRAAAGPALSKEVIVGIITVLAQRPCVANCARHFQTPGAVLWRGALIDLHSSHTDSFVMTVVSPLLAFSYSLRDAFVRYDIKPHANSHQTLELVQ